MSDLLILLSHNRRADHRLVLALWLYQRLCRL